MQFTLVTYLNSTDNVYEFYRSNKSLFNLNITAYLHAVAYYECSINTLLCRYCISKHCFDIKKRLDNYSSKLEASGMVGAIRAVSTRSAGRNWALPNR